MRLYAAGNYYLSSIQQGIQALHVLGEMFNQYPYGDSPVGRLLRDWSANHKTVICLNGGNNEQLTAWYELLADSRNTEYPVAKFHEDEQSMAGMLTSVGIVLPEKIYDAVAKDCDVFGNPVFAGLTDWESEVALKLRRMSLAR